MITKEIGDKSIAKFGNITKGIAYYTIDTEFAKYLFPVSLFDLDIKEESKIPNALTWITIKKFIIDEKLKESFIRVPKIKN